MFMDFVTKHDILLLVFLSHEKKKKKKLTIMKLLIEQDFRISIVLFCFRFQSKHLQRITNHSWTKGRTTTAIGFLDHPRA
ncbi:hypothetical protein LINPERHAP1_LOCUS18696 [Linum perenne]